MNQPGQEQVKAEGLHGGPNFRNPDEDPDFQHRMAEYRKARLAYEEELRPFSVLDLHAGEMNQYAQLRDCPSTKAEQRLALLPPDERSGAALDVLEDQMSREALLLARRIDKELVTRRKRNMLAGVPRKMICL